MSALPTPKAPSRIASRTTRRMVSSSAASAGPSAIPFAYARTVPAPTKEPTFTDIVCFSIARSHASKPRGPAKRALERGIDGDRRRGLKELVVGGGRRVPLAQDHRRHALGDHADDAAVAGEQLGVRLRLNVDDAGRHDESAGIDALPRRRVALYPGWCDAGDAVAADGHVAVEPRTPRTVHDPAVRDDHVVGLAALLSGPGAAHHP